MAKRTKANNQDVIGKKCVCDDTGKLAKLNICFSGSFTKINTCDS